MAISSDNVVPITGGGINPAGIPVRPSMLASMGQPSEPPVIDIVGSDGTRVAVHEDGTVEIGTAEPESKQIDPGAFDCNLAEVTGVDLSTIAFDVLEGIDGDIRSRTLLIDNYTKGIDLLGLKIEEPTTSRTQKRNTSKVGHPLLLEAVVKYQSGANAEMLPSAGPVKIEVIGDADEATNSLAKDFQDDFNYFMTKIAKEYYPDTDRMLFYQGYGGTAYKKVFRCPLRKRPMSLSVYLPDLIVNDTATDLDSATRVTHQSLMAPNEMKRMQHFGLYRHVDLGPSQGALDPARLKEMESQGLAPNSSNRPQDRPYTIFECDVDLDPTQYNIPESDVPDGLPVPYKITLEKDTRQVLALRRNWKEGDDAFRKRNMYVKFGIVPGLGFHDYGFLQLLGNQTRALRAVWRLLIDAGMFSNFPGGVKKKGIRMSTNEISPGPGEWVDVDIPAGDDIEKAMMPMPYKGPDAVFIQLAAAIEQDSKGLSAAVELEVGEGRANVPVGTIMAMLEQATQVMAAVHKRNHNSQAQELELIRELFAEHPEDLTRLARNPKRQEYVVEEFMDLNLSPASDPNVPAQTHRIMQVQALITLANGAPGLYNLLAVHRRALHTIGVSDADSLLNETPAPGPPPPPPDPKLAIAQIEAKTEEAKLELQQEDTQRKAAEAVQDAQQEQTEQQAETALAVAKLQSGERIAETQQQTENDRLAIEKAKLAHEVIKPGGAAGPAPFAHPSGDEF